MGRPLKHSNFGSPKGTSGSTVTGIVIGGTNNNYTTKPTYTFSASAIGATATGNVATMRAVSAVVDSSGADYLVGDILTLVGAIGTAATFTVASVDGDGEVLTVTLLTAGSMSVIPTNAATTTDNSIAGTGATLDVSYAINTLNLTNAGSGYITAPTVTLSGGNGTITAVLVVSSGPSILVSAYLVGGSGALASDIVSQKGSRRYKVTNANVPGTVSVAGVCSLVAAAPGEGEMTITATDSGGKTYYVTKLQSRTAYLTQYGAGVHEFATGARVSWNLGAAVLNTSVVITKQ